MDPEEKDVYERNNIFPIRVEMESVFDFNTPILDPSVQERIDCRRYESGLCQLCAEKRGYMTRWCRDHYPFAKREWLPRSE